VPTGNATCSRPTPPLLTALGARPHTVAELFDLPELRGQEREAAGREFVGVLVETGQAMAMRDPPAAIDPRRDRLTG